MQHLRFRIACCCVVRLSTTILDTFDCRRGLIWILSGVFSCSLLLQCGVRSFECEMNRWFFCCWKNICKCDCELCQGHVYACILIRFIFMFEKTKRMSLSWSWIKELISVIELSYFNKNRILMRQELVLVKERPGVLTDWVRTEDGDFENSPTVKWERKKWDKAVRENEKSEISGWVLFFPFYCLCKDIAINFLQSDANVQWYSERKVGAIPAYIHPWASVDVRCRFCLSWPGKRNSIWTQICLKLLLFIF